MSNTFLIVITFQFGIIMSTLPCGSFSNAFTKGAGTKGNQQKLVCLSLQVYCYLTVEKCILVWII